MDTTTYNYKNFTAKYARILISGIRETDIRKAELLQAKLDGMELAILGLLDAIEEQQFFADVQLVFNNQLSKENTIN